MQKSPSCIKIPLNKAKKILGPPYSIGELFQCPPLPHNYKIRFNIITKFSVLLNKRISP